MYYNIDCIDMLIEEMNQASWYGYQPSILRVHPNFFSVLKYKINYICKGLSKGNSDYFYGLKVIQDETLEEAWRIE